MAVSELDSLGKVKAFNMQSSHTNGEYFIDGSTDMMLCLIGTSNYKGIWLIHTTSAGTPSFRTVLSIDGVTVSTSSNKITVTNTTEAALIPCAVVFRGNFYKSSETAITTT